MRATVIKTTVKERRPRPAEVSFIPPPLDTPESMIQSSTATR